MNTNMINFYVYVISKDIYYLAFYGLKITYW